MIKKLLAMLMVVYGINHINVIAMEKMADTANEPMQQTINKVNVNTASAEELSLNLYGVGEATANAIVKYRKANGNFKDVDDLDKVKNIGRRVLEKNKDIIVFK